MTLSQFFAQLGLSANLIERILQVIPQDAQQRMLQYVGRFTPMTLEQARERAGEHGIPFPESPGRPERAGPYSPVPRRDERRQEVEQRLQEQREAAMQMHEGYVPPQQPPPVPQQPFAPPERPAAPQPVAPAQPVAARQPHDLLARAPQQQPVMPQQPAVPQQQPWGNVFAQLPMARQSLTDDFNRRMRAQLRPTGFRM